MNEEDTKKRIAELIKSGDLKTKEEIKSFFWACRNSNKYPNTVGLKKITEEDMPAIFRRDLNKDIKWVFCIQCGAEVSKLLLGLCPECKAKKDREETLMRERKEKDYLLDKID